MNSEIVLDRVSFAVKNRADLLSEISATIEKGSFVAVLGENGAGKTTMLDLIMGFKKPTTGTIRVKGAIPSEDHWKERQKIVYLSEKMDIPGTWTARDYLDFNRFFYKDYSLSSEKKLLEEFRINHTAKLGTMSAGEIRRIQIVGAIAAQPDLIVVDEITAVLDILGRRRFMRRLLEENRSRACTVVLATNIMEDLENYVSQVMILHLGILKSYNSLDSFLAGREKSCFSQMVADKLEAL